MNRNNEIEIRTSVRIYLYALEFDRDVDTDDCIAAMGVMLTDEGSVELTSPDFSSRGRFCFFLSGSFRPEVSKRFPFESYNSDLFSFALSQSAFVFKTFACFKSSVIELRKFSLSRSSANLCDDFSCPSFDWSNILMPIHNARDHLYVSLGVDSIQ